MVCVDICDQTVFVIAARLGFRTRKNTWPESVSSVARIVAAKRYDRCHRV